MNEGTYEDEMLTDVVDVKVSGPPPWFEALDNDKLEWAED